jgi:hypothetical protein
MAGLNLCRAVGFDKSIFVAVINEHLALRVVIPLGDEELLVLVLMMVMMLLIVALVLALILVLGLVLLLELMLVLILVSVLVLM